MKPIETESVVQKVINRITYSINEGHFKLGDKLPSEYVLMEELQVSRNSLREAMKILATLGIIEIKRGNGTYISSQIKPSMFDSIMYDLILVSSTSEEIVELRQTLDEAVLRLAIAKRTEKDIEVLEEYVKQMRTYFSDGEVSKAAAVDYKFHLYLLDCAQNAFLSRIVKGVYVLFEHSIEKNIRTEALFAQADEHHQEILDCLISQDYAKVSPTIANSLSSWRENVKTKLKQD